MAQTLRFKDIIEKEFLVTDLQTILRELGVSQTGRKQELIQRALQLIDDNDMAEEAKRKISEIYKKRQNVDIVSKTPLKTPHKRDTNRSESSEEESDENSSETNNSEPKTLDLSEHYKKAAIHTSLAVVVLGCVAYALFYNKVDFGRYQKIRAQNLTEVGPRMQYVLQHSTPGLVWLLFCTLYVMSKRVNTAASVPTSGNEHLTQSAKNILLNSLEQFVMSLTSQLILISYLTSKQVLNIIPTLNILFIIGRIFFCLGYPLNRGFGVTLNFVPLFATVLFINYRYFGLFF